jgi:molybdenum-dependent DNA-binding transcriptional regulator ModE
MAVSNKALLALPMLIWFPIARTFIDDLFRRVRWGIIHEWKQHGSISATARHLGVSWKVVGRWMQSDKSNNAVKDKPQTGWRQALSHVAAQRALQLLLEED